jgi:hypothetical protein
MCRACHKDIPEAHAKEASCRLSNGWEVYPLPAWKTEDAGIEIAFK